VRGDREARSFSAFCYRARELVGVESVNRAGDHVFGRKILGLNRSIEPEKVADVSSILSPRWFNGVAVVPAEAGTHTPRPIDQVGIFPSNEQWWLWVPAFAGDDHDRWITPSRDDCEFLVDGFDIGRAG